MCRLRSTCALTGRNTQKPDVANENVSSSFIWQNRIFPWFLQILGHEGLSKFHFLQLPPGTMTSIYMMFVQESFGIRVSQCLAEVGKCSQRTRKEYQRRRSNSIICSRIVSQILPNRNNTRISSIGSVIKHSTTWYWYLWPLITSTTLCFRPHIPIAELLGRYTYWK